MTDFNRESLRNFLYGMIPKQSEHLGIHVTRLVDSFADEADLRTCWPAVSPVLDGTTTPSQIVVIRRQMLRRAKNSARRGPNPHLPNPMIQFNRYGRTLTYARESARRRRQLGILDPAPRSGRVQLKSRTGGAAHTA